MQDTDAPPGAISALRSGHVVQWTCPTERRANIYARPTGTRPPAQELPTPHTRPVLVPQRVHPAALAMKTSILLTLVALAALGACAPVPKHASPPPRRAPLSVGMISPFGGAAFIDGIEEGLRGPS